MITVSIEQIALVGCADNCWFVCLIVSKAGVEAAPMRPTRPISGHLSQIAADWQIGQRTQRLTNVVEFPCNSKFPICPVGEGDPDA